MSKGPLVVSSALAAIVIFVLSGNTRSVAKASKVCAFTGTAKANSIAPSTAILFVNFIIFKCGDFFFVSSHRLCEGRQRVGATRNRLRMAQVGIDISVDRQ